MNRTAKPNPNPNHPSNWTRGTIIPIGQTRPPADRRCPLPPPRSNVYPPLNGSSPVRYRTEFTFSARTVSLAVQS
jgi:hypothetical protein